MTYRLCRYGRDTCGAVPRRILQRARLETVKTVASNSSMRRSSREHRVEEKLCNECAGGVRKLAGVVEELILVALVVRLRCTICPIIAAQPYGCTFSASEGWIGNRE